MNTEVSNAGDTETALRIEGISKTFYTGFFRKKVDAVRDVSLSCTKGEIFGFLGPNGAGKTTTIKMILGLVRPDRGFIKILGLPAGTPASRRNIGFLPENPYFHEHLKPHELMRFHAHLMGMSSKEIRNVSKEMLDLVELDSSAHKRPLRKLSKGMLQRVGLAQAMLGRPQLLILDEPMGGLDPVGRRHFRELLINLNRKGTTIFFSSHILSDVEQICTSVAIINKGRVTKQGPLNELLDAGTDRKEIVVCGLDEDAVEILGNLSIRSSREKGNMHFIVEGDTDAFIDTVKGRGNIVSINTLRENLEDLFMREAFGKPGEESAGSGTARN